MVMMEIWKWHQEVFFSHLIKVWEGQSKEVEVLKTSKQGAEKGTEPGKHNPEKWYCLYKRFLQEWWGKRMEKNEKDQPTNSHLRARNCRVKKTNAGTKIKKKTKTENTKTMITCGWELVACPHKQWSGLGSPLCLIAGRSAPETPRLTIGIFLNSI